MKQITIPIEFGQPCVTVTINNNRYILPTGTPIDVEDSVAALFDGIASIKPYMEPSPKPWECGCEGDTGGDSTPDSGGSNGGYARFNDGATLTWAELQDPANGAKYGYNAAKITDTTFEYEAFAKNEYLVELVIPEGVTHIDGMSIDAKHLESITLPSTAEYISYRLSYYSPVKLVRFNGTMEQLRQLDAKHNNELIGAFIYSGGEYHVDAIECIDGTVTEN